MSIKLTNEPPAGLKANLERSFMQITHDQFSTPDGIAKNRVGVWKNLLFGLSFFHASLQERRKFGPLGFNVRYDWNQSDLSVSISVLQLLLGQFDKTPFDALRYLTGEIGYGGRVTDFLDQRCVMALLRRCYDQKAFKSGFSYIASGTDGVDRSVYSPPPSSWNINDLRKHISDNFPDTEPPCVFGLHGNANITLRQNTTSNFVSTLLSLYPGVKRMGKGGGAGFSLVASVKQFQGRIPQRMDAFKDATEGVFSEVADNEPRPPLEAVLIQECDRYNTIISTISHSLGELEKALAGLIVMNKEMEAMGTAISRNTVPHEWEKVAYPSTKPLGAWFADLTKRVEFFRNWLKNGMPNCFWISAFYFPQGFLTAVLQTHARKHLISIDKLVFDCKVLPSKSSASSSFPSIGVNVDGLLLEGAAWDNHGKRLTEQKDGELLSTLPPLHLIPTETEEVDTFHPIKTYKCPVYKTLQRAGTLSTTGLSTNFVLSLFLPSDKAEEHWIGRGAAAFCANSE
eukprot:gnl/Carplike_NY0171/3595_a4857_244.p1 GENE.gnl/Carplike_NY0171/3595_a4857_244~~gnl/Carplike_NY0171/3595_a4857_244.p1  ORF type:complete len:513 (-),score=115.60 gnl/Carplike_NY0171/3595_a4857_244:272-1810(-)